MNQSLVETAFWEFSEVGRVAVVIELKLRMLAERIPHLEEKAHAYKISKTEEALLPYLLEVGLISNEEKRHLELSRLIRNKIFHCEFEAAVKFIEELTGDKTPTGGVFGAKIDELEGDNILEKLLGFAEAIQNGRSAKGTYKVDEKSTREAGIFGWLLDASIKNVFLEGQKAAAKSVEVIDRVFDSISKSEIGP